MEIEKNDYRSHWRKKVRKYKAQGLGPKATYEKTIEELENEKMPTEVTYYTVRNYYYKPAPKISV
ncbi:hypothetical protein [Cytobacillus praedii]|uniref:hypothetical protein n=1 Tax=Cytobacillus praedii TaxID=1742358 RepID=UPI002E1D5BDA|nr:hypothetical protein [Cytobacillus praedii]